MSFEIESPRSRETRIDAHLRDGSDSVVIGLVNNMPDSALEATAAQFSRLLSSAADSVHVRLRLSFLPEVPRGQSGLDHLDRGTYWSIDTLLGSPPDALIVTGMEPCAPLLQDEPYWERMGELLSWAQSNTRSSIWSCLAAHLAVERLDGIRRRRLPGKRCGVFAHSTLREHPLLAGVAAPLYTPHSRWNELPEGQLRAAGYTMLSSSPETGADMFVKEARSLLMFFQGHPEYEETTLLREYRRDVGRFLRGQQPHFPSLPQGYFPPAALELLSRFERRARDNPNADLLAEFPMTAITETLINTWSVGAASIYRNWLAQLVAARNTTQTPSSAQASSSRV